MALHGFSEPLGQEVLFYRNGSHADSFSSGPSSSSSRPLSRALVPLPSRSFPPHCSGEAAVRRRLGRMTSAHCLMQEALAHHWLAVQGSKKVGGVGDPSEHSPAGPRVRLRDSPSPIGSAVQSARSIHLKSRNIASRIVDSTQTLVVQPVKTRYSIPRPRRIISRSVP